MTKPDDLTKFITMLMMKQEKTYTKQNSESTQKNVFSKETRKDE